MTVFDQLEQAIKNKQTVTFLYDDLRREVEPFLLGETTSRRLALRGYQTAGGSRSGKVAGWHLFSLDKIRSLAVTDMRFSGIRDFYNPADKAMIQIFARI